MRVAILGGGQLARMLSIAAHRIGIEPWVVDPSPEAPAAPVARHVQGDLDDPRSWEAIAHCDVATAEIDHAPGAALAWLADRMPVRPGARAFAVAGDRLAEKRLFHELGIDTAPCAQADSLEDLWNGLHRVGLPAVLKLRREGYDGRGQRVIRRAEEASAAWRSLGGRPAIVEGLIDFDREVSVLAARGVDGDVRFWSPVENRHEAGILRRSRALAPEETGGFERAGRRFVGSVLESLDYVGVLAVEFFEVGGRLVANELACRVHNSGHWTEEGAETGQFENHLRAITGRPLGSTRLLGPTAMVNLVGIDVSPEHWHAVPGARLHWYGKRPAPGRKVGHVTLRADTREDLDGTLARAGTGPMPTAEASSSVELRHGAS
ncbi:MAG: 5-(carboxyamino)imidazole ribonucleotide synthase [Proteobacteria bacterium]|nr:5-(carboxyamino)imidazole ribonucleotide synthase [Pseudomonadota bacterium]